ncbi:hypothetical protein WR25_23307 isoform B [Diploscapter pachys]|uniref:Galectin n=1 Tax=Diploscapter pachys TaxID=2018661 RepID=A0A2A2J837_9BILA|nr:hypothetical protein WR25_23307 isoform A [Diploscapter pachys]PAV57682.1 hypothetical protein WR25_23307 isoform B [Diploscapter pachys]
MHPVYNPMVPGAVPLTTQIQPGSRIIIHGNMHKKDEFAINLVKGTDIVLHVNFRTHKEHNVVVNSCLFGTWGVEQRHKNPLKQGDHFSLHIACRPEQFDIECNGHYMMSFQHRADPRTIQAITLQGQFACESITIENH